MPLPVFAVDNQLVNVKQRDKRYLFAQQNTVGKLKMSFIGND